MDKGLSFGRIGMSGAPDGKRNNACLAAEIAEIRDAAAF
jgi:hypothetical protein